MRRVVLYGRSVETGDADTEAVDLTFERHFRETRVNEPGPAHSRLAYR